MSSLALSVGRKAPRITHKALADLAKKLDPAGRDNWRILASFLDQRIFTDEWIQGTECRCQREGFSPTAEVLRVWQHQFGVCEDIPVQQLIDTLQSMGRKDVASIVDKMMKEHTFLDFHEEPSSLPLSNTAAPAPAPAQPITQVHSDQVTSTSQLGQYRHGDTCMSQIHPQQTMNGTSQCTTWYQANPVSRSQPRHPPQESSYHQWADQGASDTGSPLRTPNYYRPAMPTPHQQNVHVHGMCSLSHPNADQFNQHHVSHTMNGSAGSQPREIPLNFTRSNRSLNTDRSNTGIDGMHSDPNPNRQRGSDHASPSSTWPPRGWGRASRQSVNQDWNFSPIQTEDPRIMLQGPGYSGLLNSIEPLRSASPVITCTSTTATGASPVPVEGSNKAMKFFITYPFKSYRKALDLGYALKAIGQEVMVDRKSETFASVAECQETPLRHYNEATHIIVICNVDYIDEIEGRVETPLNTRFIYNLMNEEYLRGQRRNVRFVPIIDHSRVRPDRIPPAFNHCPKRYTDFVFNALQSYHTARQPAATEVSIERTVYTSHR